MSDDKAVTLCDGRCAAVSGQAAREREGGPDIVRVQRSIQSVAKSGGDHDDRDAYWYVSMYLCIYAGGIYSRAALNVTHCDNRQR